MYVLPKVDKIKIATSDLPKVNKTTKVTCPKLVIVSSNLLYFYVNMKT